MLASQGKGPMQCPQGLGQGCMHAVSPPSQRRVSLDIYPAAAAAAHHLRPDPVAHCITHHAVPCPVVLCWLQVTNPATGQVLATLPKMKSDETLTAIAAAHAVFPQWSNTTAKERGALLRK